MKRLVALLASALMTLSVTTAADAASSSTAVSAVATAVTAAAAQPAPAIEYTVDESTLPFGAVPGFEDSLREWGVLRGAGWRIEIPADWNGELVMWAHGFRGTGTRLFFNPEEVPFRQWLLENGYAWAASTYSKNDYNVGTAVTDTRDLAQHFRSVATEQPERVYIAGVSMGGHVSAASIERYPGFYDGALPVCGVLGDYELFDFFLDFNLAAQQIALGSSQFPVAPDYPITTANDIKRALEAAPGTWPVVLNADGQAFKQLVELRSGGDRPNFDEAWLFWNSFPQFGSGIPGNFLFDLGAGDGTVAESTRVSVSNIGVVYETDLTPGISNPLEESLNRDITRIRPDPAARVNSADSGSPQLTGLIRVPVLTMHNLGDLFVPFHMETEYEARVADRGRSHLLVQRAIRGVGHCDFTTAEYEQAMADLVEWVENGTRPAGDDVGDPAAVAAADFGCAFTDPTVNAHFFAAPCPAP